MTCLFISGIFRSGTTLLARALSAHPAINVLYQPFAPFFKKWRNLYFTQALGRDFDGTLPMGIDYFSADTERQAFYKTAGTVRFGKDDLDEVTEAIKKDITDNIHEKNSAVLDYLGGLKPGTAADLVHNLMQIVQLCSNQKKATVIGIKEIWCEEFCAPLFACSQCKTIHVMRDPRGVFASRNTGRHLASCGGKKYPLLFITRSWRRSCSYVRSNRARPGYAWLRYEDLVRNPEKTLKDVSESLGVSFVREMANPACYTDGQGNPWNPNSTFETQRMFNRSSIDYWQKSLTPQQTGAIEFLCHHEMAELGYQRLQPDFGERDFMDYVEDHQSIIPWLKQAPYVMDQPQKIKELHCTAQ